MARSQRLSPTTARVRPLFLTGRGEGVRWLVVTVNLEKENKEKEKEKE